jgi:hypothetical protein
LPREEKNEASVIHNCSSDFSRNWKPHVKVFSLLSTEARKASPTIPSIAHKQSPLAKTGWFSFWFTNVPILAFLNQVLRLLSQKDGRNSLARTFHESLTAATEMDNGTGHSKPVLVQNLLTVFK